MKTAGILEARKYGRLIARYLTVWGGVRGTARPPHPSSPAPTEVGRGVQNPHLRRDELTVGECMTKDPQKKAGLGTAGLPGGLIYGVCGRGLCRGAQVAGHPSPLTRRARRQARSLPQVRQALGDVCQVLASLANEHRARARPLYGAGPKSRSWAAQEMFLQRMNQVFSLR